MTPSPTDPLPRPCPDNTLLSPCLSNPSRNSRTLKHLITYSPTIPPALRTKLLAPQLPRKDLLHALSPNRDDFHLSQFPLLFGSTPRLKLIVPTFAVYGACEDVRVVEKFRTGEYKIPNLTVLDEATTRAVDVGGVRLRLLGLGGALVMAKMFDNGAFDPLFSVPFSWGYVGGGELMAFPLVCMQARATLRSPEARAPCGRRLSKLENSSTPLKEYVNALLACLFFLRFCAGKGVDEVLTTTTTTIHRFHRSTTRPRRVCSSRTRQ